tara:strand:- start:13 stop:276 length:264 start_codon:yes stop_codon:yes gene_type:complete
MGRYEDVRKLVEDIIGLYNMEANISDIQGGLEITTKEDDPQAASLGNALKIIGGSKDYRLTYSCIKPGVWRLLGTGKRPRGRGKRRW